MRWRVSARCVGVACHLPTGGVCAQALGLEGDSAVTIRQPEVAWAPKAAAAGPEAVGLRATRSERQLVQARLGALAGVVGLAVVGHAERAAVLAAAVAGQLQRAPGGAVAEARLLQLLAADVAQQPLGLAGRLAGRLGRGGGAVGVAVGRRGLARGTRRL